MEAQLVRRHHNRQPLENQCSSYVSQLIKAPLNLVWSLVRRFDRPQRYKPFVSRCEVTDGLNIGSVRKVHVKSGLPATTSTERLELLDDEAHMMRITIVGGDHRLQNYSSTVTVHAAENMDDGQVGTLVIESFVVDIPQGSTKEDTQYFILALIRFNLKSLADVAQTMAKGNHLSMGRCLLDPTLDPNVNC